jgi:hypothetical protein
MSLRKILVPKKIRVSDKEAKSSRLISSEFKRGNIFGGRLWLAGTGSASGLESQLRTRTSGSVILDRHLPATLLECPPCSEIKGL